MKFQLDRTTLLNNLLVVQGVVERRERLPILGNILIVLKDETISLSATDMEIELVARVGAPGGDGGEVTVPARKLLDICRTLPEDATVEFSTGENRATLRAGRSRFTLNTLPAADFPTTEAIEGQVEVSVTQRDLKELIERTHFAMANQDVRYYLNGLLLGVSRGPASGRIDGWTQAGAGRGRASAVVVQRGGAAVHSSPQGRAGAVAVDPEHRRRGGRCRRKGQSQGVDR